MLSTFRGLLTEYDYEHVRDGQREEIIIGCCMHVAVASDHHTCRHITNDSSHQNHAVDDAQRYNNDRASVPLTQVHRQVFSGNRDNNVQHWRVTVVSPDTLRQNR